MKIDDLGKRFAAPLFRLEMKVLKNQRWRDAYVRKMLGIYAATCQDDISLFKRPKRAEDVVSIERPTDIQNKTAIILQGLLLQEDDFTVETVKIYRKIFPGCLLIVSTWDDSPPDTVKELEKIENCKVILNRYPPHSGYIHLNYQIVSTMAGLRLAKELGKEYALKTRADQRVTRIGCIEFMHQVIKSFPLDDRVRYQKQRLVLAGATGGRMFSAYWPGDFFAYGTTEDMLRYWDCELSDEDLDRYNLIDRFRENGDSYRQREESGLVPEVIIQESFFKRMGDPIGEFNIKSFWERAKRQFIFISGEDVQLFFPKYLSRYDTTEKMGLYCSNDSPNVCLTYNWNFMRWFNLYSGVLEYRSEYEAIHENPRS